MKFFMGFVLGCSLIACAAAPVFPYKFFHLTGNNFAGTLLGPAEGDDIPFRICTPVNGKQQCVVILYSELNKLVVDYKATKQALIDCQRGR